LFYLRSTRLALIPLVAVNISALAVLGCRSPSNNTVRPVPDAEQVVPAPAPEPHPVKERRVQATVTRWLGIGWGHVLDVDLAGDIKGDAQLYVPAGDPAATAIIPRAASSGSKLRLQLRTDPRAGCGRRWARTSCTWSGAGTAGRGTGR
jgi:hypothetical protein